MNVIFGVSRTLLDENDENVFWCSFRKYNVKQKDIVVIYVTLTGVSQIFEVLFEDSDNQEIKCLIRNMQTIRLKHVVTFENPITANELKQHTILKEMNAVRRNFQATAFLIEPKYWNELLKLLLSNNPNQVHNMEEYQIDLDG